MARIPVAQRRSDFINAAVAVIASHGIDGATTRRIAEQANANVAMLHYCYDSKEDLFADVYQFVAGKYADVARASDPHTTVVDAARQLLRGIMELYVDSPDFAAATVELISWARRQHEDRGIAVYDNALAAVREVLTGTPSGQAVEPATIEEIAYVIATLADGFAVNWFTYGDRSAALQQMDVVTAVLEGWLATRLQGQLA